MLQTLDRMLTSLTGDRQFARLVEEHEAERAAKEERERIDTEHLPLRTKVKLLLPFVWPHGHPWIQARVAVALLIMVVNNVLKVYTPQLYKQVIDDLGADDLIAVPATLLILYCSMRFITGVLGAIRGYVWLGVAQHTSKKVKVDSFRHLHTLSTSYHVGRRMGEILRNQDRGSGAMQTVLDVVLFSVCPTLLQTVLVSSIFFAMAPEFAIILLSSAVIYGLFTYAVTTWRARLRRLSVVNDNRVQDRAVDSLLNVATVKAAAAADFEVARYTKGIDDLQTTRRHIRLASVLFDAGQSLISTSTYSVCALLAARRVVLGDFSVGDFVMTLSYVQQLQGPLQWLGASYRQLNQNFIDMEKFMDLLRVEPEVADRADAVALPPLGSSAATLEFRDVQFAYNTERPILHGISFVVPSGKTTAIVGPSGAGKSTIAKLAMRLYDVSEGAVLVGGCDVRTVTQDSLRDQIGLVPQDTTLFNDTIGFNCGYGRPEASRGMIEEAAKTAHLYDFVQNLPEGFETITGERGLRLSGGEKQRVSIARMVVKKPPVVILDEATSSLDSLTESQIMQELRTVCDGITTLIIAHRLSTIAHADEILVLDGGAIVERGTHNQLLRADGMYKEMWERQARGDEDDNDGSSAGGGGRGAGSRVPRRRGRPGI